MDFSRKQLSGTYKDYLEQINDTTLYFSVYTVDESKPYILFLNGGPGDVSVYARCFFEAICWGINTIYLDQRGCGKSKRDVPRESFLFNNLMRDIDGVLDKLKLRKVFILGHSWGAVYGVKYSLERPERVITLIAVDILSSWEKALTNFYNYIPFYIENNVFLLRKLRDKGKLNDCEIEKINRLIGFIKNHYKGKDNEKFYARVLEDILDITVTELDKVIDELEDDLKEVRRCVKLENPWEGWNSRRIRWKYGLYDYSYKTQQYNEYIDARVREIYRDNELKYSEVMEEGIPVNDGWGSYDSLQDIKKLEIPFYYFYGEYDVLFKSLDIAEWVYNKFGKNHAVVFEKSGHSPFKEETEHFKEVVERIYAKSINQFNAAETLR